MDKRNYSITLEKEVVRAAQSILYPAGKKLSPIINDLLKKWLAGPEAKKFKEENKKKAEGNQYL